MHEVAGDLEGRKPDAAEVPESYWTNANSQLQINSSRMIWFHEESFNSLQPARVGARVGQGWV